MCDCEQNLHVAQCLHRLSSCCTHCSAMKCITCRRGSTCCVLIVHAGLACSSMRKQPHPLTSAARSKSTEEKSQCRAAGPSARSKRCALKCVVNDKASVIARVSCNQCCIRVGVRTLNIHAIPISEGHLCLHAKHLTLHFLLSADTYYIQ